MLEVTKIDLPKHEDLNAHVLAGSFVANWQELAQKAVFTVNLTQEYSDLPCTINLPIKDFSVPKDLNQFNMVLAAMVDKIVDKEDVFFGCFGGIGRTGIVLAVIAKLFGVENKDLVSYVRENLHYKALETNEQIEFVKNFNINYLKNVLDAKILNKKIINSTPQNYSEAYDKIVNSLNKPTAMDYSFLDTILKNKKTFLIYQLIKDKALNVNQSFYINGDNVDLLDLAKKYKCQNLYKDLVLSGAINNKEFANFKDTIHYYFLSLSGKIPVVKKTLLTNKIL